MLHPPNICCDKGVFALMSCNATRWLQNDPEEERRVVEEQRKAQEAAARTARLQAKAAKARRPASQLAPLHGLACYCLLHQIMTDLDMIHFCPQLALKLPQE